MKIQLIDSRPGVMKTIILKEWMRIGLSICLLGLPVILGYFSIQIADARNAEFAKNSTTPALGNEFDLAKQTPELQSPALAGKVVAAGHFIQKSDRYNKYPSWSKEQSNYHNGLNPVTDQALTLFATYGDALKKGQILVLTAVTGFHHSKTPHKNGRIIDPASYIHRTIR